MLSPPAIFHHWIEFHLTLSVSDNFRQYFVPTALITGVSIHSIAVNQVCKKRCCSIRGKNQICFPLQCIVPVIFPRPVNAGKRLRINILLLHSYSCQLQNNGMVLQMCLQILLFEVDVFVRTVLAIRAAGPLWLAEKPPYIYIEFGIATWFMLNTLSP